MADIDILSLPVAVSVNADAYLPLVQGGTTYRGTAANISMVGLGLDSISTTPGSLLYRGSSAWVALAPGTLGQVLTQGASDTPQWATDLAADISVGSTIITGGTTTRVLYDNAGVLGEYAISGTGSVAMTTSPTFVTPTLGAATATSLTVTQGTITADAPQLNGTVTWNSGGTTFTAWKLNVTDTASASASLLMDLQVGGSTIANIRKDGRYGTPGTGGYFNAFGHGIWTDQFYDGNQGLNTNISFENQFCVQQTGNGVLAFKYKFTGGSGSALANSDLVLDRDAANVMAQRNGTNAQTFRVYNTFTDASNYRRIDIAPHQIVANAAGTGTGWSTGLDIGGAVGTTGPVRFYTSNTGRWTIDGAAGHLLAFTDNTYDIGASGATRPRSGYFGTNLTVGATSSYLFASSGGLKGSADGVFVLLDTAGTSFGRLQFGGTTSSFPALKRSSTALQARLADDSAYAPFSAELVTVAAGTATPAAGSTAARLLFGTTAGFGIYYGSGVPTVSAAQGSLYLRSDGAGVSERAYINNSAGSGTTWTAIATAA